MLEVSPQHIMLLPADVLDARVFSPGVKQRDSLAGAPFFFLSHRSGPLSLKGT